MERYKTFKEFYPYYLSEHDNKYTKLMHFIGTSIGIFFPPSVSSSQIYLWTGLSQSNGCDAPWLWPPAMEPVSASGVKTQCHITADH